MSDRIYLNLPCYDVNGEVRATLPTILVALDLPEIEAMIFRIGMVATLRQYDNKVDALVREADLTVYSLLKMFDADDDTGLDEAEADYFDQLYGARSTPLEITEAQHAATLATIKQRASHMDESFAREHYYDDSVTFKVEVEHDTCLQLLTAVRISLDDLKSYRDRLCSAQTINQQEVQP